MRSWAVASGALLFWLPSFGNGVVARKVFEYKARRCVAVVGRQLLPIISEGKRLGGGIDRETALLSGGVFGAGKVAREVIGAVIGAKLEAAIQRQHIADIAVVDRAIHELPSAEQLGVG